MRISILITALLFLAACNNDASRGDNAEDTLAADEPSYLPPDEKLVWTSQYDSVSGRFSLKKQRPTYADSLLPANIINDLNAIWQNIRLEFRKISGDTLYVAIPESEALTNRMGSAGAEEYITVATYNLTELENIRYVNYSFKAGDHLSPGVHSREDLKDYR